MLPSLSAAQRGIRALRRNVEQGNRSIVGEVVVGTWPSRRCQSSSESIRILSECQVQQLLFELQRCVL